MRCRQGTGLAYGYGSGAVIALVTACGGPWALAAAVPIDVSDPDGLVLQKDVLVLHGKAARDEARRRGIPVTAPDGKGGRTHVVGFRGGRVLVGGNLNLSSADTIDADEIWIGGDAGYDLDGSGVFIGQWESDLPRRTHVEFDGRSIHMDPGESVDCHATHVAGTMIASGVDGEARGMASGATLLSFVLGQTAFDMDQQAAGDGLRIANHSWGLFTGWQNFGGQQRWYGDQSQSLVEDYYFGFYDEFSQSYDQVVVDNPKILICKSAGNDRSQGPDPDEPWFFWDPFNDVWVQAPAGLNPPPADFEIDGGYDTLSDTAVSKNVMVVGAVFDVTTESVNPSDIALTAFTSWGPTDDGRIKPDIVANGFSVYSASDASDSAYERKQGTSMSAPAVAGATAQLIELWRRNASEDPDASTLKAVMLHTAKEAGPAPGPDYRFGWGLLDARASADLIAMDVHETWRIQEITLGQGGVIEIPIEITADGAGSGELRVTIAWTDPAGTPAETSVDPTDRMLVNDLDVRVLELDGQQEIYEPWVLDPISPSSPAAAGDNDLDNVEQVLIASPRAGRHMIRINHEGPLAGGSQRVSIAISGGTLGTETLYVDADAGPGGDGSSWSGAYLDLEDALAYARSRPADLHEIWIAEGEYVPSTPRDGSDFRTISFDVPSNARLVGGFAGNEAGRDDRPGGLVTLLSGDFNGDDAAGGDERRDDNAYSVLTIDASDGFVELRDVHVRGGFADGNTIEHKTGGAVLAYAPVLLDGCTFEDNTADFGGAVAFRDAGRGTVHRCSFIGNRGVQGGGLYSLGSSVHVIASEFRGNTASLGGGMYARGDSEPVVSNSLFTGNRGASVGAIRFFDVPEPRVYASTIAGNSMSGTTDASAIAVRNGDLWLTNTIVWGNEDGAGADGYTAQVHADDGALFLANSLVRGGPTANGNLNTDPRFVNPTGWDGVPGTADDNLRVMLDSPVRNAGRSTATRDIVDADRDGDRTEDYPFDLLGLPRFSGSADIGCYEQSSADLPVVYVNASGSGGDGSTWTEAYTSLDAALTQAEWTAKPIEIWIAGGTHTPQTRRQANDPRSVTFTLQSGVAVVGGFDGTEQGSADRSGGASIPVLSGDLDDDDGAGELGENAYSVVTASGTDRSALLVDVIVEGGNADGIGGESWGGGVMSIDGGATLRGVTIRSNRATQGGGLYASGERAPLLINARFEANEASTLGGGIYARDNGIELIDSIVIGNSAVTGGGGVRVFRGDAIVDRTRFLGNTGGRGGGLYVTGEESVVTTRNSLYSGNIGGGIGITGGFIGVEGCTIALNDEASTRAGGIDVEGASSVVIASNTIVADNLSSAPGIEARQVRVGSGGRLDADRCLVSGWTGMIDGGVTIDGIPGFADRLGPDGVAGTEDDDFSLTPGSDAIDAGGNGFVDASVITDLVGNPRFFDDPYTTDSGSGGAPVVDIGAIEYQGGLACNQADLAEPFGLLDLADISVFISAFVTNGSGADLNADGVLDLSDIGLFVSEFTAGCS